jgi:hypothetical protein
MLCVGPVLRCVLHTLQMAMDIRRDIRKQSKKLCDIYMLHLSHMLRFDHPKIFDEGCCSLYERIFRLAYIQTESYLQI